MKNMKTLSAALAFGLITALTATATVASAADSLSPLTAVEVNGQTILANGQGLTVYTFDPDQPGKSNCNGSCARTWPPVLAPAALPANPRLSVITRDDGSFQIAYDGRPVYLYVGDSATGETNGDGIGGVWHIVPVGN